MTKFTKGPWVSVWNGYFFDIRQVGGRHDLASVNSAWSGNRRDGMSGHQKANGYLIAAAPDLYEALEEALCCVTDMGIKQQMINALAKARGE